jgi:hypothetical protein
MSEDSVTIVVPEPHYTLFHGSRNGMPDIVVVNDALLSFQHTGIFAWHLEITLHAEDLVDQGMPAPDESKLLFEIGDKIEQAIVGYNALFLARSTWNGFRQLAYRVYDPDVADEALQQLLSGDNARFWEFRMDHDPSWAQAGFYFQLFPLASGNDA